MASCKYCEEWIEWDTPDGGMSWVPTDPATGRRHRCVSQWGKRKNEEEYARGHREGYDLGYRAGLRDGKLMAQREAPRQAVAGLNKDEVLKLLRLCHPDVQPRERVVQANEITKRLTAMLDAFR